MISQDRLAGRLGRAVLADALALEDNEIPEHEHLENENEEQSADSHGRCVEVTLGKVDLLDARALQAEQEHEDGQDDGGETGHHEKEVVDREGPTRDLMLAREVENTRGVEESIYGVVYEDKTDANAREAK